MLIDAERSNAQAVLDALAAFGAPMAGLTVEDFQDASSVYQIALPPFRIDILKTIDDVEFEEAWRSRVDVEQQGIAVHYLGRHDLIRNKQATGRLQDLADAEAVQNAAASVGKTTEGKSK